MADFYQTIAPEELPWFEQVIAEMAKSQPGSVRLVSAVPEVSGQLQLRIAHQTEMALFVLGFKIGKLVWQEGGPSRG